MKSTNLLTIALGGALVASCGGTTANPDFLVNRCSDSVSAHCVEIAPGDVAALLEASNTLSPDTTLILGRGEFVMTSSLTIRAAGVHIIGQGIDDTILNYGTSTTQFNGIDAIGDNFLVQDLTVVDVPKDGIRVEASNGVVFRRIRATWTTENDPTNGSYGIYPVKSSNVLVEDSFAENASDAGLYVGQCRNVIVRRNTVRGNVAGLEIENVQYADVYENHAEDNTGGLVIFDLPGNPIAGRDIRVHNNVVQNNNRVNFAPGGTVQSIPVGTGTFAMASRRVEITNNTYVGNNTVDIAIVSGLIIEENAAAWELDTATLVGNWNDLNLTPGAAPNTIRNYRSENIVISGNTHDGSGASVDPNALGGLGVLLAYSYPDGPTDSILYDGIGEASFHSTDASMNSNTNHLCVGGNTNGTFANMNVTAQLEAQAMSALPVPFFRPASPFAPFDCTTLVGGAVAAVMLP